MTTNTVRKTTSTKAAKVVRMPRHHPAEKAGAAVHNAVENGIATVADTVVGAVATVGSYAFNFVKGLVKGK